MARVLAVCLTAKAPCEPVSVKFVVDKIGTGTSLSPSTLVSPVSVIPLMMHTHLDLHVVGDRKTNGQNMGPFYKKAVSEICQQRKESVFI